MENIINNRNAANEASVWQRPYTHLGQSSCSVTLPPSVVVWYALAQRTEE